ncbi:Phosphoinositide-specific phospholipase C, efhand-like protein [Dictyocaulus viviparus]|uniref:Phosphoinositide-specific phospholipase C, efhand-like protein n=1 Tax=Dictyocaulus viviparus TaxID=29172 RepID=A0A0D8XQY8_DICVI|nr:Phosphoinositide-specific phospholipase C, efhand-like protein [Dictyocaulus viviparus]
MATEDGGELESSQRRLDLPFADREMLRSSLIKHVNREKSPYRKTVSFSSRKSDRTISNVSDCWHHMQNGCEFIKLRGQGRHFRRFFSLDDNLSYIRWTPTNKKPHKAKISIDDIREIRLGKNTELLRQNETNSIDIQEECLFSIVYGNEYDTLNLLANSGEDANIWVTGLMALTSTKYDCRPSSTAWSTIRERWLGTVFDDEDPDRLGFIDQNTAVHLIQRTNPNLSLGRIRNRIKEIACVFDEASRGKISRDEFIDLYKEISTRPEIYFLMVRYSNKDYLSCEDLRIFLETEQGMVGVTTQFCEGIVEQFEPIPEARENNFMSVDGSNFTYHCFLKLSILISISYYRESTSLFFVINN